MDDIAISVKFCYFYCKQILLKQLTFHLGKFTGRCIVSLCVMFSDFGKECSSSIRCKSNDLSSSREESSYDVVISGGGMVGTSVAASLGTFIFHCLSVFWIHFMQSSCVISLLFLVKLVSCQWKTQNKFPFMIFHSLWCPLPHLLPLPCLKWSNCVFHPCNLPLLISQGLQINGGNLSMPLPYACVVEIAVQQKVNCP